MTPPDDLPSPKGLACDSLLKRANEATGLRAAGALVPELLAALESDRALLRRFVEAWDVKNDIWERERWMDQVIDEARARIGEGK